MRTSNQNPDPERIDSASLDVPAAPGAMYEAFATPEALMSWLPPQGMRGRALEYAFREGGRYRIELTYEASSGAGKSSEHTDVTRGRFVTLEPARRIVWTVEFESPDPQFAGEMRMTWLFTPLASGTRITVQAEHVPAGIGPEDHAEGLRSSLENLARHLT
jgi:uncharacterized protein YndB with AHSA1/START domain